MHWDYRMSDSERNCIVRFNVRRKHISAIPILGAAPSGVAILISSFIWAWLKSQHLQVLAMFLGLHFVDI